MDVGSTSSTASSATASATPIAQATAINRTNKTGESSFDEQMKNTQSQQPKAEENTQENKVENENSVQQNEVQKNEETVDEKNDEKKQALKSDKPIEEKQELDLQTSTDLLSLNIQKMLDTHSQIQNRNEKFNINIDKTVNLTKNIGETLDYQTVNMDENDAMFFINIVENNQAGLQNVAVDIQQAINFGTEAIQKSASVSKTLLNALQNTVKTGQAVRIDFGNDIAVIMRVTKDGAVMANFIPGDRAVEQYLKNNIDFLKQRFDEENIPYSQLSYSQHQQQRERQQQNKEDKHE